MAIQTIVYNNNTAWTVPANCYLVHVECWGGGGGASASTSTSIAGGGGGGGAYARSNNISVTPGASITMVVGAGGGPGTGNNNGANGTGTGFNNNQVYARFGAAANRTGQNGAGGTVGNNNNTGNGCLGQFCYAGGRGNNSTGTTGGGGGAAAGNASAGANASSSTGATGANNGGSGGSGGANNANGSNGVVPGGGGGGSGGSNASGKKGGNGAAGQIILTWTPGYSLAAATGAATSTGTVATPHIDRHIDAATGATTSAGTTAQTNWKFIQGTQLGSGNSFSFASPADRQSGKTLYFWFNWDGTAATQNPFTENHATSNDGIQITSAGVASLIVDGVAASPTYTVSANNTYGCALVWSGASGTCSWYIWAEGASPSAAQASGTYGSEATTGCKFGAI
jgi:hypothetical protein